MVVEITDFDLFNNDVLLQKLDELIALFEESRHTWFLADADVYDYILKSKFISGHRNKKMRSFVEKAFRDSLSPKQTRKAQIDVEEKFLLHALTYLRQPVTILLENGYNDRPFIESVMCIFGKEELQNALKNGWVTFGHLGSCGQASEALETFIIRDAPFVPRALCILDSDKKHAKDNMGNSQKKAFIFCQDKSMENTHLHILYKREMENYLPDDVFPPTQNNTHKSITDAYLELNEDQKDFYDMEKGFSSPEAKDKAANIHNGLFDDLKSNISAKLENGFQLKKKSAHKNNSSYSVKDNFPKLFKHKSITKINLLARCAHQTGEYANELEKIVAKITNLL